MSLQHAGEWSTRETCAVKAASLHKNFGETRAINGIDLQVQPGELFGIVGPDGAGKTTLLQILSGVMQQSSGSISIFGSPPRKAGSSIGYLTQHLSIYKELSVDENLRYSAGLRKVKAAVFAERRKRLLQEVDLLRFSDRLAGHLSGGMRQKLGLCCALTGLRTVL